MDKKSFATAHAMRKAGSKAKKASGIDKRADATVQAAPGVKEESKASEMKVKQAPKPMMAQGGMIKTSKPKAKMTDSSVIKARPYDHVSELNLEDTAPPMKHEGMSEDKEQSEEEFESKQMAPMLAEGGEISDDMDQPSDEETMEHAASIAAGIMAKRAHKQFMAVGGMVDIDENAEEQPNDMTSLNKAALKENYDSDMDDVSQPEESNEHADEREEASENKHDRVSAIMKKRKSPIQK